MSVIAVSLHIPEDLWSRAGSVAEQHHVDADDIVFTAVEQYLKWDAETRLAVEEGIRQADAGELIDHEEVVAWFEAQKQRTPEAA